MNEMVLLIQANDSSVIGYWLTKKYPKVRWSYDYTTHEFLVYDGLIGSHGKQAILTYLETVQDSVNRGFFLPYEGLKEEIAHELVELKREGFVI